MCLWILLTNSVKDTYLVSQLRHGTSIFQGVVARSHIIAGYHPSYNPALVIGADTCR